jgi:hypothetical protein
MQSSVKDQVSLKKISYLAPQIEAPKRGFSVTRSSLTRFNFDNNNAFLIFPSDYVLHLTATSDPESSFRSLLFDKNRANALIHLHKIFPNYVVGLDSKRGARLRNDQ